MSQPLETGKRMVVDMPTMWRNMRVGPSRILTQKSVQEVIRAGNLIVLSNWVGGETAKRIAGKDEVLQMPHRLVFLTVPFIDNEPHAVPEGARPSYYLMALTLSDPRATPQDHKVWKKTERHQLYLLGVGDSSLKLAQELSQVLASWRGRYRYGEMGHVFRVEADGTLCFQHDFNYPPFADYTDQKKFDLAARGEGEEVRLIEVKDKETKELAKKIVELNRRQSEQRSKLF